MAWFIGTRFTVVTVMEVMSMSVTIVVLNTGTVIAMIVMKVMTQFIVIHTDLDHTSLVRVNTISALS
jgi:hypothetical protein